MRTASLFFAAIVLCLLGACTGDFDQREEQAETSDPGDTSVGSTANPDADCSGPRAESDGAWRTSRVHVCSNGIASFLTSVGQHHANGSQPVNATGITAGFARGSFVPNCATAAVESIAVDSIGLIPQLEHDNCLKREAKL